MAFSEPAENIKNLDLKEGMKVADFGAGSGFYTIEAAKRVLGNGQVFAVDVQKDMLSKIQSHARDAGLRNVSAIWGDIDNVGGSKIKELTVDRVIISNVLFQSEHKENLSKEAFRILKNGGEVMIVDWTDSFGGMGPQQSQIVSETQAVSLFEKAGFKVSKSFYAGDHHFGIIMKKE